MSIRRYMVTHRGQREGGGFPALYYVPTCVRFLLKSARCNVSHCMRGCYHIIPLCRTLFLMNLDNSRNSFHMYTPAYSTQSTEIDLLSFIRSGTTSVERPHHLYTHSKQNKHNTLPPSIDIIGPVRKRTELRVTHRHE